MDYQSLFSNNAKKIKPSGIRKYFSIAAEMEDIISLGVGEPDFKTPWIIRSEGIKTLDRGKTWYSANAGMAELQEEIAKYLKRKFSLDYKREETIVTVGGSEAIDLTMRAFINPGDEVIIPEPCFVAYRAITELCGGVPVCIPTKAENGFKLTTEELKNAITKKTKLLVFPFPNNPTGAVMRRNDLEEITEVLKGTDILVLSDEIYAELTYGEQSHVSIASISRDMWERTVVVNGFSKAYAMTGWRLGYAAGPEEIIEIIVKLHQYAIMCASTTSQYAGITALKHGDGEIVKMTWEYNRRRRYIVDRLNEMGLTCFSPEGAFYVFPSVKSTGLTSGEFCEKLIYGGRVAVVPGDAFGDSGEGYIRICYAYSIDHIKEAMNRIEKFIQDFK